MSNILRENKRWSVILGAVLLQFCLGALYSWSLFNRPLMEKFSWSESQVVTTYSITIFIFSFSMLLAGRLHDKYGPRIVATIGGILYGVGVMLSSIATSLWALYFYYGIIAGTGVGFAYVCPLTTSVKWFPNRKGFITGIIVGSFGLGSFLFKSLIATLISSKGVSGAFFYLGIIYMALVLIGAQFLKTPNEDDLVLIHEKDKKYEKSNTLKKNKVFSSGKDYTVKEVLHTRSIYVLWFIYLVGCLPGLLVIGIAYDIGIDLAHLTPSAAAFTVTVIALFNTGGRLIWGTISDYIGRPFSLLLIFILSALSMFSLGMLPLNPVLFFILISCIAFCFGGIFATVPPTIADYFGSKNYGSNFSIVAQAYGIAALLGTTIQTQTTSLNSTFMIVSCISVVGIILAVILRKITPGT
ncbi:MAG: OFA family MFS transporter [Peptostreptococcales bacterium]